MKKKILTTMKSTVLFCSMALSSFLSYSADFTATASGNWSDAATWGGTAPGYTIQTDDVTIPAGITVTLDGDLTLNGLLSELVVNGSLITSNNSDLTITSGSISGSGTVIVDNVMFSSLSALTYTGSFTANTLNNSILNFPITSAFTINNTLTLSGGALKVNSGGTLTLGNNSTIIIAGGSLSTTGGGTFTTGTAYNVIYSGSGDVNAGAELMGSGLQNVTIDVGTNNEVTLMDDANIKGTLTLSSGTLNLNDQSLNISGDVATSGDGNIKTSSMSDINITTTASITGALRFSGNSNTMNNLTVNVGPSNSVSVSGNLVVNGNLALTSGILHLQNSNLRIAGNISDGGTAFISITGTSDIIVSTATAPTGSLRFTSGNSVDDFTVNITNGGTLTVGSNLMVNGTLTLTSGKLDIGNNKLTIASSGSVSGYNSNSYIITGATGSLAMGLTTSSSVSSVFPVGTANLYFPASVKLNTGSNSGMVMVGVMPNIYADGTSGTDISLTRKAVDATWNISSDISSGLNLNLQLMWTAAAEVNSFDRTQCYISHYTNSSWDASASMAASSQAGLYNVTRANITSLSPFAVLQNENSSIADHTSGTISMYPNPSSDYLFINDLNETTAVEIMNTNGQVMTTASLDNNNNSIAVKDLPAGIYFIKVGNTISKFTKM